ncbi:MAG: DMT family transporter [Ruminococcaceae bacterium]|nr:DMT family transporter [Oscillospiraceae bacterium]
MNSLWVLFIFIYSFLKGSRDAMKKAALKKSSSDEILFFYSLLGFILILPFSGNAFSTPGIYIFYSFLKALIVASSWMLAFVALRSMTVSLYGIMDMSRMVFSTLLGVFVLGEEMTLAKALGVIIVTTGLLLANSKSDSPKGRVSITVLLAALLNCILNSISGTMDKVLMKSMTSDQLQFWFMLFLLVLYGLILIVRKEKVSISTLKGNYWIPLMSLSLVFGDRLLFIANASPESQVTVMTVIKQSSVFVTVLTGWLFFKEKNILFKTLCAIIILSGIMISVIWG